MNQPVRRIKEVDKLTITDWLAAGYAGGPVEVLGVHPYTDGSTVLVVYRDSDGVASPMGFPSGSPVQLATDAEIEAAQRAAGRARLVNDLRAFAEAIADGLPLSKLDLSLHIDVETQAELERVASVLGLKTRDRYGSKLQVSWPEGRQSYDDGLYVVFYGEKAKEPEPAADPDPTGQLYSRADDEPDETPVGGRVPAKTGAVVDGGQLVTDGQPPSRSDESVGRPEDIPHEPSQCDPRHCLVHGAEQAREAR